MIVYHPKERYDAVKLFDVFVDFLIHQIASDKLEVTKSDGYNRSIHLRIWLIRKTDLQQETCITFRYEVMRGWEITTPIERFEFTLCQGGIVKAQLISQGPNEYDKMLELFKACLAYFERHDPDHHKHILESFDISSLERKNWKKSRQAIEQELAQNIDMRMATEDFERKRKQALADLTSKYKGQGYEITE